MSLFSDLGDQLLTGMLIYGYPILGLTLLLGALGLPVPSSLVATVSGTLVANGDLDAIQTLLVALIACVVGDLIGYGIGRVGGRELARRHGRWFGIGATRLAQGEALFNRWAGPTLLVSRSLLSIVGPAVNLLAGAALHNPRTFVMYDAIGRLIWVGFFVGLGYVFAGSAETAADLASSLSGLVSLGGLTVVVMLAASRPRRSPTD